MKGENVRPAHILWIDHDLAQENPFHVLLCPLAVSSLAWTHFVREILHPSYLGISTNRLVCHPTAPRLDLIECPQATGQLFCCSSVPELVRMQLWQVEHLAGLAKQLPRFFHRSSVFPIQCVCFRSSGRLLSYTPTLSGFRPS